MYFSSLLILAGCATNSSVQNLAESDISDDALLIVIKDPRSERRRRGVSTPAYGNAFSYAQDPMLLRAGEAIADVHRRWQAADRTTAATRLGAAPAFATSSPVLGLAPTCGDPTGRDGGAEREVDTGSDVGWRFRQFAKATLVWALLVRERVLDKSGHH